MTKYSQSLRHQYSREFRFGFGMVIQDNNITITLYFGYLYKLETTENEKI